MNDVVVVVPGIAGSVLVQDGNEVWGLSGSAILRGLRTLGRSVRRLRLPSGIGDDDSDDGVIATGLLPDLHLIPGLWRVDGYGGLLRYLERRFELTTPSPNLPGNYIKFAYDWRLSNVVSARRLQATVEPVLEQWRAAHRRLTDDDQPKLVFVCHSMGGLVARYYIEVLGGREVTRTLITIGTPFLGSMNALDSLANGHRPGWGRLRMNLTELIASFPSVYQLLPIYPCIATATGMESLTNVPVPHVSRERVKEAADFHTSIAGAVNGREPRYEMVAIKGQVQPTGLAAELQPHGVGILDRYQGADDRGDGTVPRFSAHPPEWQKETSGHVIFAADRHASLQNDQSVQNQLHGFLTTGQITRPMGGQQIGVVVPDMIEAGNPLAVEAVAEDETLPLVVAVESSNGESTIERLLSNLGGGRYRAEIPDLVPGAYRITVGSSAFTRPVDPVTDVSVVWNPAYDV